MSKKALVVGIDAYPSCPLNGCVNDAKEIKELLETNGDGSPNFEVKFAPNVPTKHDLLELLNALFVKEILRLPCFTFLGMEQMKIQGV